MLTGVHGRAVPHASFSQLPLLDDTIFAHLFLPLLVAIFLSGMQVETEDPGAAAALNIIRVALEKAEEANPGVVHELVDAILESEQAKGGEESISKLLRIAGRDLPEYNFDAKTKELEAFKAKSGSLKSILVSLARPRLCFCR
jgi:hypothetical protein